MTDFNSQNYSSNNDPWNFNNSSSNDSINDYGSSRTVENDFKSQSLMDEYNNDKEYILKAISEAIKTQNYNDAQAFITKYQSVAANDPAFNELTNILAQHQSQRDEITKLEMHLSTTPDHDYQAKAKIYQQLLQLCPDRQDYQHEFDRCLQSLPANVRKQLLNTNSGNDSTDAKNQKEENRPFLSTGAAIASSFYILLALVFFFDFFNNGFSLNSLVILLMSVIGFFLLTNIKFNPLKNQPTLVKIVLTFVIWLSGCLIFFDTDEKSDEDTENGTEVTAPETPETPEASQQN